MRKEIVMNCDEARIRWHESHDTGVKDIALENHLKQCDACMNMALQLTTLTEAFDEMRRETEAVGSTPDWISKADQSSTARHRPLRIRFLQLAATIALATSVWLFYSTSRNNENMQLVDMNGATARQTNDNFKTEQYDGPPLGITLRGKSEKAYLAVAQPMSQPRVQFYRLYPTIAAKDDTSDF